MTDTAARLLRLLTLLQRTPEWTGERLAAELGITTRTLRRDVTRLRALGYPVATRTGPAGGYALRAGTTLPPLMFDADEAAATLLALQFAAADGADAAAGSALDKLRRVLPDRLRRGTDALLGHTSTVELGRLYTDPGGAVPSAELLVLTRACRDRYRVRCAGRTLEPLHVVHTMGHWYLHAYDLGEHAWLTLRVDALEQLTATREPSTHRLPDDGRERVAGDVKDRIRRVAGRVRVHAPLDAVAPWIAPAWGSVTSESETTCVVDAGADTYDGMARWLLLLDAEITVLDPPELAAAFGRLARRARRASARQVAGRRAPARPDQPTAAWKSEPTP